MSKSKIKVTTELNVTTETAFKDSPLSFWFKDIKLKPINESKQPTTVREGSKMSACLEAFRLFGHKMTRKMMMERFVQMGCTDKGAATYYANCQRLVRQ